MYNDIWSALKDEHKINPITHFQMIYINCTTEVQSAAVTVCRVTEIQLHSDITIMKAFMHITYMTGDDR